MKHWMAGLWLLVLAASPALAGDEAKPMERDAREMAGQVRELSREMTRVFIEKLRAFLDQELERLRQASPRTVKELKDQLQAVEKKLEANPEDPEAHYELGRLYDRLGDGANAIIHMRRAESLFKEQGNIKGLAESRRELRGYLNRYGFKEEDFELQP